MYIFKVECLICDTQFNLTSDDLKFFTQYAYLKCPRCGASTGYEINKDPMAYAQAVANESNYELKSSIACEADLKHVDEEDILSPQFICMTCKTVIGSIWDDDENQCKCKDVYYIEVYRVASVNTEGELIRPKVGFDEKESDWVKNNLDPYFIKYYRSKCLDNPIEDSKWKSQICSWNELWLAARREGDYNG